MMTFQFHFFHIEKFFRSLICESSFSSIEYAAKITSLHFQLQASRLLWLKVPLVPYSEKTEETFDNK